MLEPKELAKHGYIKFDTNTGIAANGMSICLISDLEREFIEQLRTIIKPNTGSDINVEIKISHISEPYIINIRV